MVRKRMAIKKTRKGQGIPRVPEIQEAKEVEIPKVQEGKVVEKKRWKGLSFWDKRRIKKKGDTAFLIKMFFSNGTCREFVIATPYETFTYKKRTYYLRKEEIAYNLTQNQFELNFFDDFPVPINIKKIVKEGKEAFWSVTPQNLKPLIKMNYVKALASTDDLNKWLKMIAGMMLIVFLMVLWIFMKVQKITKAMGG